MGKHVKKKIGSTRDSASSLARARRDRGEDNFEVDFDFFEEPESQAAFEPEAVVPAPAEPVYEEPAYTEPAADEYPEEYEAPKPPVRKSRPPQEEPPRRKPSGSAPAKKRPSSPSGKNRKNGKSGTGGKKSSKSRKKKDNFRKGLTIYLILFTLLIAGALAGLWVILDRAQQQIDAEDAEAARIKAEQAEQRAYERAVYQAPQLCFQSWLDQCTPEYWVSLWEEKGAGALESHDLVLAEMTRLFASDTTEAFKSLDYTAETPVYVLKNGEDTLARITLSGSETFWNVSHVELLIEGQESASVRVSSGSKVYCNGIELGQEYITDSSSYFEYEFLRDSLINPVTWDTYTVEGLLVKPEMTVDPVSGRSVTETAEGDFLLCLDDAAGKPYQDKAVAFVRSYLNYFMNGGNNTMGNMYAALAHVGDGTQAYKDLKDTYNGVYWNTAYSNIDTSNTTAGGVVIWADNCYSVDVTYDANCTYNGNPVDYDDATMRIYFLQTANGFVISNFETL